MACRRCKTVVSTRTTLPILSNVLLRAGKTIGSNLPPTDLDVTIACAVEAKIKTPGATTVPVKKLFGIVRASCPTWRLDLEVDEKHSCAIRSGASFYRIHGLSADEFPPMPQFREEKKVILPQETVKSMMKKTSFAMSTDESRYVLNGIFFSLRDHKMTMVATDGRRLALVDEEVDITEASQGEFIVPAKTVNELNRLLQDKGTVEIRYADNQASFTLKDEKGSSVLIVTKLIEGNYPNYRQVIPAETKERVALVREEFLHALRRAEIMTSEKSNSVKLSFGKNKLEITANSPEVGEAQRSSGDQL